MWMWKRDWDSEVVYLDLIGVLYKLTYNFKFCWLGPCLLSKWLGYYDWSVRLAFVAYSNWGKGERYASMLHVPSPLLNHYTCDNDHAHNLYQFLILPPPPTYTHRHTYCIKSTGEWNSTTESPWLLSTSPILIPKDTVQ